MEEARELAAVTLLHTSSAAALREVVIALSTSTGNVTLSAAVEDYFGTPANEFGSGLLRISQMINNIRSEIEQLDVDEERKKHLLFQLHPLQPLESGTAYSSNIQSLRSGLLNKNTQGNLLTIDLAFSGNKGPAKLQDPIELSNELDEIRSKIAELDFPKSLKVALDKQISALIDAIKRFDLYGPDVLSDCIAQLVGTLAVRPAARNHRGEKKKGFVKSLLSALIKVEKSLDWAENISESAGNLSEDFQEFGGFLENMTEQP